MSQINCNENTFAAGALRRTRLSKPGGKRVREAQVRAVSHPGDISIGPNQYGSGSRDRAKFRKFPCSDIFSVDQLDPVCPCRDVCLLYTSDAADEEDSV